MKGYIGRILQRLTTKIPQGGEQCRRLLQLRLTFRDFSDIFKFLGLSKRVIQGVHKVRVHFKKFITLFLFVIEIICKNV